MPRNYFIYFKVAPRNFDATVYDTDDLSITRGGSLTLLEMPRLLQRHLQAKHPNLVIEVLQDSASELFFRAAHRADNAPLTLTPERGGKQPKGLSKQKWNKALQRKADALKGKASDDALREAAGGVLAGFKVAAGAGGLTIDLCAGLILGKMGQNPSGDPQPLSVAEADTMAADIRAFLSAPREGWPLDLFRFGVAWLLPGEDAAVECILAKLETALGFERLHALGCPVPPAPCGAGKSAREVLCALTGIYGVARERRVKKRPASASAARRFDVGRKEKPNFYRRVLERAEQKAKDLVGIDLPETAMKQVTKGRNDIAAGLATLTAPSAPIGGFANDFDEIVADAPRDRSLSAQTGMAVLTLDGNDFGALRSGVDTFEAYGRLADYLDVLKGAMLGQVLRWIGNAEGMRVTLPSDAPEAPDRENIARFETLLWGGDEFTFVCPAWMGWRLACILAEATRDWVDLAGNPLRVATGLVFAPHDAPIRDLCASAEALEHLAKADRGISAVQAIVYEGIDRVHYAPEAFRRDWLGVEADQALFAIPATDLPEWPKTAEAMGRSVGRSALQKWYFAHERALAKSGNEAATAAGAIQEDFQRITADGEEMLPALREKLFSRGGITTLVPFAQLNLFMDYLEGPVA